MRLSPRHAVLALLATGLLCLAAYARFIWLPFISDDYFVIALAREYGPVSGWAALAQDGLYRCRATSLILTWWWEWLFGLNPVAFNLLGIALHILNTWLVFALGSWAGFGWRTAAAAAAFFAVHEGHQEAVVWLSAQPELLVFFFVLSSLLCWLQWIQSDLRKPWLYAAAMGLFVLALLSKEPAAVLPALLLATALAYRQRWKTITLGTLPFFFLSAVYFALSFATRQENQHYFDGSFSFDAPVPVTMINSTGRLFWFWGLLSVLVLVKTGYRKLAAGAAVAWILLTLLPYSFLTYMPRVPSRHTYLASAGLAVIVGMAFLQVAGRLWASRRWAVAALAGIIVLHNCAYLWTRKHGQYVERAAPTEELIRFGRATRQPIFVGCFPFNFEVIRHALIVGAGKAPVEVIYHPGQAKEGVARFCYHHRPEVTSHPDPGSQNLN